MSLTRRNQIVPQMADYDNIGDQWVPYLMRFDRPGRLFPSVSTDNWGFRNSIDRQGKILKHPISTSMPSGDQSIGVVLGSSAVFGVGASHDRFTIPSKLNSTSDTQWLNYGGRAFNSTQELLLLQLFLPQHLQKIVVFSGVNNLTLACLSRRPSPVYNSFFAQSSFERAMINNTDAYVGVRKAFSRLVDEVHHRIFPSASEAVLGEIGAGYQDVLTCFRRDMRILKALADGLSASLCFALQPLATWLDKPFSEEESNIFRILDELSGDWRVLASFIGAQKDRYFKDVEHICYDLDIPFCNMNQATEFNTYEWLFVDRVHLTDRGNEIVANILIREFAL